MAILICIWPCIEACTIWFSAYTINDCKSAQSIDCTDPSARTFFSSAAFDVKLRHNLGHLEPVMRKVSENRHTLDSQCIVTSKVLNESTYKSPSGL